MTEDSQEADIHQFSAGSGKDLLLVHGAGGNAAVWWQQIERLSASRRVTAYDLPSFGKSRSLNADGFAEQFAKVAVDVLDSAGIDRTAVVGQSLGGWTALRLAIEHPERVSHLILSCTMAGIAHPPALQSFQASLAKMDERGPASLGLTEEFRTAQPAKAYVYDQIGAFNEGIPPDLGMMMFSPNILIPVERLKEVSCPVLIISGEHDPIWPPAAIAALVGHFQDARMEILKGTGHSPYFEQPEQFNQIVEDFIAG